MKKLKDYKQFNEAIYSADWKEDYNEEKCKTLDLNVNDKFKMTSGKSSYKTAFYRGKKDDLFFFSYKKDGTVYKIPKDEIKEKFVEKI